MPILRVKWDNELRSGTHIGMDFSISFAGQHDALEVKSLLHGLDGDGWQVKPEAMREAHGNWIFYQSFPLTKNGAPCLSGSYGIEVMARVRQTKNSHRWFYARVNLNVSTVGESSEGVVVHPGKNMLVNIEVSGQGSKKIHVMPGGNDSVVNIRQTGRVGEKAETAVLEKAPAEFELAMKQVEAIRDWELDPSPPPLTPSQKPPEMTCRFTRNKNGQIVLLELEGVAVADETLMRLHLVHKNLTKPTTLADLQNLRTLRLVNTSVGDGLLEQIGKLSKLEELRLDNSKTTSDGLARLTELEKLRELALSGTKVNDDGLKHLQCLNGLRSLKLNNTEVTDHGIDALLRLSSLKKINTAHTKITEQGRMRLEQKGVKVEY